MGETAAAAALAVEEDDPVDINGRSTRVSNGADRASPAPPEAPDAGRDESDHRRMSV